MDIVTVFRKNPRKIHKNSCIRVKFEDISRTFKEIYQETQGLNKP